MTLAEMKEIVNTSNSAKYTIKKYGVGCYDNLTWNMMPDDLKNSTVFKAMPCRIYCGSVKEWRVVLK